MWFLCVCECESQSPYLFFFLKPPHLPLWSAVSLNPDPDPDPGPLTRSLQSSDKQLLHHPAATSPKTSSSKLLESGFLFVFCVFRGCSDRIDKQSAPLEVRIVGFLFLIFVRYAAELVLCSTSGLTIWSRS